MQIGNDKDVVKWNFNNGYLSTSGVLIIYCIAEILSHNGLKSLHNKESGGFTRTQVTRFDVKHLGPMKFDISVVQVHTGTLQYKIIIYVI